MTHVRKTKKSQATRSAVLKAALELFKEKGFAETTMRDIATRAEMAVGAAYYHFDSKDDLVFAFYVETHEEARKHCEAFFAAESDLRKRITEVLSFKFAQLTPYRPFLGIIARNAADPAHHLSPFSTHTKDIRDDAIKLFSDAVAGTNIKVASGIAPYVPKLLWLFQMGLVFFWVHDKSQNQIQSQKLQEKGLSILLRLFAVSKFPLMAPVNRSVSEVLELVEGMIG